LEGASSRAHFARALAAEAASGKKALLLAPLGAGKTHTLLAIRDSLREASVPAVFVDLFTAASTPEQLLALLAQSVLPFMEAHAVSINRLARDGAADRHRSSRALLGLLDLLATRSPSLPFVWLVDEATEIRSLAYFPDLAQIEGPFALALNAARGAILTSSYLGLAVATFPEIDPLALQGLVADDLADLPSLRSDSDAIAQAIAVTSGGAATLLPLVRDMRDSRDLVRSLVHLLKPGEALDLVCRRHYEVLLMRSRGYAVSKRAAEAVAGSPGQRLTDLFPMIGRTAGASRQYLRWLVEVGLLTQVRKRYDFADPVLGLWASLYLGRGDHPTENEIHAAVVARLAGPERTEPAADSEEDAPQAPRRRADRFEEID
jgi:hypothetical protein